jgi:hypothetical protein
MKNTYSKKRMKTKLYIRNNEEEQDDVDENPKKRINY